MDFCCKYDSDYSDHESNSRVISSCHSIVQVLGADVPCIRSLINYLINSLAMPVTLVTKTIEFFLRIFSFTSSTPDSLLKDVLNLNNVEAETLWFECDSCDTLQKWLSTYQFNEHEYHEILEQQSVEIMPTCYHDNEDAKLKLDKLN